MYNNTPNTNTTMAQSINTSNIMTPTIYNTTPQSNLSFNTNNNMNNYSLQSPLGFFSPFNSIYPSQPSPLLMNNTAPNNENNNLQGGFTFFSVNQANTITNDETMLDNMLSKKNKNKKSKIKRPANSDSYNNISPLSDSFNISQYTYNNNAHLTNTPPCNTTYYPFFPHKQNVNNNIQFINAGIINNNVTYQYNFTNVTYSPIEDERNKINIDLIASAQDKRTTLMIKNIPNKYTITTFLDEINVEFQNKYDIFYLPIDYGNKCNLGFAFINFIDPLHIIDFYETYRGKKWKRFNSEKICELVYAKIQGKKELVSHFEKGKVLSFNSEDKRPLILPTPNPPPKVKLPLKVLDTFIKAYPFASYVVENNGNNYKLNIGKFIVDKLYAF